MRGVQAKKLRKLAKAYASVESTLQTRVVGRVYNHFTQSMDERVVVFYPQRSFKRNYKDQKQKFKTLPSSEK